MLVIGFVRGRLLGGNFLGKISILLESQEITEILIKVL
jgi:hypothetical protein